MADAFIYDAIRLPRGRGKADGSLHEVTALNLAAQTLAAALSRPSVTDSPAVPRIQAGGNSEKSSVAYSGPRK